MGLIQLLNPFFRHGRPGYLLWSPLLAPTTEENSKRQMCDPDEPRFTVSWETCTSLVKFPETSEQRNDGFLSFNTPIPKAERTQQKRWHWWIRCISRCWGEKVKLIQEMQEPQVWSLGWKDPLEKGTATRLSILAWRIPQTEEPGGLQSKGSDMSPAHDEDLKPYVMFLFRLLILDWSQSFFFILTFSDSW